jgi:hypothetical protein
MGSLFGNWTRALAQGPKEEVVLEDKKKEASSAEDQMG